MASSHLILCCPLLLLPSIFPMRSLLMSQFFTSGGQSISFSFSISPSNEYSGLISSVIDWFDLLAVQGTLKSFLQHPSSKASFLQCSTLWSNILYGPTFTSIHDYQKTIALTRWTFVSKVMPLLFNMLSRLVIAFLPRSKGLFISWLQSPSAVILKPKKIRSATGSYRRFFKIICTTKLYVLYT